MEAYFSGGGMVLFTSRSRISILLFMILRKLNLMKSEFLGIFV